MAPSLAGISPSALGLPNELPGIPRLMTGSIPIRHVDTISNVTYAIERMTVFSIPGCYPVFSERYSER